MENEKIIIHGTSSGKLYIKEKEFFANRRVYELIKRLYNSRLYKRLALINETD